MINSLAVDFGNTCVKLGYFQDDVLVEDWTCGYDDVALLQQILSNHPITHAIIVSVVDKGDDMVQILQNETKCMMLNGNTDLPFLNAYLTGNTLGMDRIALVAAAYQQYPHNNNLVISVGTAITYNVLLSNRAFRGGNITPGIQMRLKALNHFTDKLPLVDMKGDTTVLGYDTDSSIRSGVINGAAYEIDGFIDAYKQQFKDINVFLTGGDASVLGNKLKSTTFVDFNLQLKGLNSILLYNAK